MESFDEGAYNQEARERWGETDAYRESTRRLASYSPEQKAAAFKSQQDALNTVIDAKRQGFDPTSEEAIAGAERCRLAINDWYYECDTAMHQALGQMYVSDQRFVDYYESLEPGLAHYLRDAIDANAARTSH